MTRKRLVLICSAALAIAVAGAGLAGAQSLLGSNDPAPRLRELQNQRLGRAVAAFASQPGRPDMSVYVARLADGSLCVSAATADRKAWGAGCNPATAPLGSKPFTAMFSYDGGPAAEAVREARLFGLARRDVAALRAEMSDGSFRELPLSAQPVATTAFRVYAYRVSTKDLNSGVTPLAVVAYGRSGNEIARQATGLLPGS